MNDLSQRAPDSFLSSFHLASGTKHLAFSWAMQTIYSTIATAMAATQQRTSAPDEMVASWPPP